MLAKSSFFMGLLIFREWVLQAVVVTPHCHIFSIYEVITVEGKPSERNTENSSSIIWGVTIFLSYFVVTKRIGASCFFISSAAKPSDAMTKPSRMNFIENI